MKFSIYPLGELVSIKYGKDAKKVFSKSGTIPIYGTGGLMGYATKALYDKPSVLIGRKGTIEKIRYVEHPFWTVDTLFYTIVKEDIVIPKFLYYNMLQLDLGRYNEGTSIPSLRTEALNRIELSIPDIETQKKIASILSALDAKIELNNAINENLEQQAQAIFKYWFVDFEPFGGVMPADWRYGIASEIIEFHDSQRVPLSGIERNKMKKIYPYYGATSRIDYVDNYLFDGIYLLLGEDGTVVDRKGFPILQYVYGKFWVNNHAHIITGKLGYTVESLYLLFNTINIKHIVTGAVQQKISQENLKKVSVIIPNTQSLEQFNSIIQPIFSIIRNNRDEIDRLSSIRDTLLPKLMKGEIDVSKVKI